MSDSRNNKSAMTYINQKIRTRQQLKDWMSRQLGYPLISVELTDEQLDDCIDNATLIWTKYAALRQRYISLDLSQYPVGDEAADIPEGFDLSEFRVASVYGISTGEGFDMGGGDSLWSVSNCMLANGTYPFLNTGHTKAGGFTTYQAVVEFVKTAKRVMCEEFDFSFNRYNQTLKLIPNPITANKAFGYTCIECEVVPPDEEIYGNEYVKRFAMAYAKITLGTIRSKFGAVALPGGGTIDTTIGEKGEKELEKLIDNIRKDETAGTGMLIG